MRLLSEDPGHAESYTSPGTGPTIKIEKAHVPFQYELPCHFLE